MNKKNLKDLVTDRININTSKRNLGKSYIAESVLEQTIKDEKQESELQELEDIIRVTDNNQSITERKDGSLTYRKGGKINTISDLQKSYLMDTFMNDNSYENGDDVVEEDAPIQFGYHDAAGNVTDQQPSNNYSSQEFYPEIDYDPVNNPWHKALSERFAAPPPHLLNYDWKGALEKGGSDITAYGGQINPNHLNLLADYAYSKPNEDPRIGGPDLIAYQNQFAGNTTSTGKDGGDRRRVSKGLREKYPSLSKKESKLFYDYLGNTNLGNISPLESSTNSNEYANNFVGAATPDMLTTFRKGQDGVDNTNPQDVIDANDQIRANEAEQRYQDSRKSDGTNLTDKEIVNNENKKVEKDIKTVKEEVSESFNGDKDKNKKQSLRTIGDKIGLASVIAGGLGQLGTALASRHSDLTPKNVYQDITKEAESYLKRTIGEIDGLKKQAASEIKSRYSREPDTAMTYQQRRARELSRQTKVDAAIRDSNMKHDGIRLGIQGELSKMIAEGDKYSAMGEEKMRANAQAQKDAYYTSLGQAAGTLSAAGQKLGQDMNVAKQNKEIVDALQTGQFKVVDDGNGNKVVFDGNGNYVAPLNQVTDNTKKEIVPDDNNNKGTDGGGVSSQNNQANTNEANANETNANEGVVPTEKEQEYRKGSSNNVEITSRGNAGVNSFTDIEGNEITGINDYNITEDGSLRLNPSGDGYYLDGQKVYGEPNYITKAQYKEITGQEYSGELQEEPSEVIHHTTNTNLYDSKIVGQANIGTEVISTYKNEWGKTVNVMSPLNVNAAGQPVFESISDVPKGYDNSSFVVAKDENGVFHGYEKSDNGKWVKQTKENDKIKVYTPFEENDPLMISTMERNPDSGITYGNPYMKGSKVTYDKGGYVTRSKPVHHPYIALRIVGKI